MPVPAGMEDAGGTVNDYAEPPQTAAPLQTAKDSRAERKTFDCSGENELSGMDGERLTALKANRAGASSSGRRPVGVEVGLLVALEDDKGLAEAEIDRAGPEALIDLRQKERS